MTTTVVLEVWEQQGRPPTNTGPLYKSFATLFPRIGCISELCGTPLLADTILFNAVVKIIVLWSGNHVWSSIVKLHL